MSTTTIGVRRQGKLLSVWSPCSPAFTLFSLTSHMYIFYF